MPKSADKTEALLYHDRIAENRTSYLQGIREQLPDKVSLEEMVDILDQFFRSYDLRLSIAGDKPQAEADQSGELEVNRPEQR